MPTPQLDTRSDRRKAQDEQLAAEPQLPVPDAAPGDAACVRKTTVTFSLRVPVVASETEPSTQLDELLETWRATKGVTNVAIEWKTKRTAAPNRPSMAYVEAKVEIEADAGKELQRLYNKLTRVANKEPGRLASRSCDLIEMFG